MMIGIFAGPALGSTQTISAISQPARTDLNTVGQNGSCTTPTAIVFKLCHTVGTKRLS